MTSLLPDSRINAPSEFSETLQQWRDNAAIASWAELGRRAQLSRHRIRQLRAGQLHHWPLDQVVRLCQVLHLSLSELMGAIGLEGPQESTPEVPTNGTAAQAPAMTEVRALLEQLEPFLRQWPTAVYAARHHNLPAEQLIRVLAPIERLLTQWNLSQLGEVGDVVPFDPAWQQPLTDECYETGQRVSIRYVGYRWQNKLWLRAQVRACPEP